MVEQLVDFLITSQNSDGGWGAVPGKDSQTEATAFALLGLNTVQGGKGTAGVTHGLRWLATQQRPDGSWPLSTQIAESSWTTSLAVLTLGPFETHRHLALRGANWLLQQKGRKLGLVESLRYRWARHSMVVELNPDLQAWSWTPNTFSWVEPTAYALLAIKKLKPFLPDSEIGERLHQGDLLLYDRMCAGGGWNYGNARVLGEELWPYPDVTAVALIALQDRQTEAANQQSLRALRLMLTQVQSGLALSWSLLCFSLYGQEIVEWKSQLQERYDETRFLDEIKVVALALLALSEGAAVFRV